MTPWFLAQVKPNADLIARRNLERQRFVTFQPLERRTQVRKGKFVSVQRPFFPGYMFLSHPESSAPWSLVNSTYGVARLVAFAGRPAPVPEAVIAELLAACGPDNIIHVERELAKGSAIAVSNGPFAGFIGEVERIAPDSRVHVLLEFMGKKTRVNLSAADVRLAEALPTPRVAAR